MTNMVNISRSYQKISWNYQKMDDFDVFRVHVFDAKGPKQSVSHRLHRSILDIGRDMAIHLCAQFR